VISLVLSDDTGFLEFHDPILDCPPYSRDLTVCPPTRVTDEGIEAASFFSGFGPVTFEDGTWYGRWDVSTAFRGLIDVSRFEDGLIGSYRTIVNDESVVMTSTDGLWTGFEGCCASYNTFVGRWVLTDIRQVPEPGTLALLGLGLAGIAFTRRARRITKLQALLASYASPAANRSA
jgi:PEP-CTERM motif